MSHALLGESFDIHGGGIDLQFPHHENEIAQSCCAHPEGGFAKIWMHNEMLQVEGKKMSKSLGNFFTVRDLLEQGVPGEVIRFVMLSTHYSKPMDWTEKKREEADLILTRWLDVTLGLEPTNDVGFSPFPGLVTALSNDINSPEAIRILSALQQQPQGTAELAEIASALHRTWVQAKIDKDFSEVDRQKAVLVAAGYEVNLSPSGAEIRTTRSSDPAKLEALL
jgi:cysteinyl-tRNA synthetase